MKTIGIRLKMRTFGMRNKEFHMIKRTFGEVICDPSKAIVGKRYQFADYFLGFSHTEIFDTLIDVNPECNHPFETEDSVYSLCREILSEEEYEVEEYEPFDFSNRDTRLSLIGEVIETDTILSQITGFELYKGEWVAQTPYLSYITAEVLLNDFHRIDGGMLGVKS